MYASYQGAQLAGLVHAFYDFLMKKTGKEVPERNLDLAGLMGTPYYETVDVESLRQELDAVCDLFLRM